MTVSTCTDFTSYLADNINCHRLMQPIRRTCCFRYLVPAAAGVPAIVGNPAVVMASLRIAGIPPVAGVPAVASVYTGRLLLKFSVFNRKYRLPTSGFERICKIQHTVVRIQLVPVRETHSMIIMQ